MVQNVVNKKCVPGGDAITVETELVSIASAKVLSTNKSSTIGSGPVAIKLNIGSLSKPISNDEAESAKEFTSVNVRYLLVEVVLKYLYFDLFNTLNKSQRR